MAPIIIPVKVEMDDIVSPSSILILDWSIYVHASTNQYELTYSGLTRKAHLLINAI